jgi:hypothetical protein
MANLKHGARYTREYASYCSAKGRCTNPTDKQWKDYGGRGIKFLFTNFEQFFAELGNSPKGKTLDRIDNDGHYETGNVRWATKKAQANNRRKRKKNTGVRSDSASGLKGVWWSQRRGKWVAYSWVNRKTRHIGYFTTAKKAAAAVLRCEKKKEN